MKIEIGNNIDNIYGYIQVCKNIFYFEMILLTFRENSSEQGKRKRTEDENSPPEKRCVYKSKHI